MDLGALQNKFVSQDQLDDKRKKRQEEWEKVRKAEDPIEAPEEIVDNRCLYEKLQEQKQRKEDEYEEQHRLKNAVRGLDEDETKFLDFVSDRQEELMKNRENEDAQVMNEYRSAIQSQVITIEEKTATAKSASASSSRKPAQESRSKRSQSALLGMAVKRKSAAKSEESDAKRPAVATEPEKENTSVNESADDTNSTPAEISPAMDKDPPHTRGPAAKIIAVLPGLCAYSHDSSDSQDTSDDSSSGDSEDGLGLLSKKRKVKCVQQVQQQS